MIRKKKRQAQRDMLEARVRREEELIKAKIKNDITHKMRLLPEKTNNKQTKIY